ncbi:MAG: phage holin family protein [Aphanothece sp. CMT-3BRIN-NPC111]|jgi:putative membrane protein|nr:phage holin family protein [Aphanothece sp. CMT-3BRIN-NPC111]
MNWIDILIAWLVTSSSLLIISQIPLGVEIDSTPKAFISAAVLGVFNTIISFFLFTLPNTLTFGIYGFFAKVLTLGLFSFVLNVIALTLAAKFVDGFRLRWGVWTAVIGGIGLALVSNFITGSLLT